VASWAGTPEATLAAAVVRLESLGRAVCRSSLYSTEPVGFAGQPRFGECSGSPGNRSRSARLCWPPFCASKRSSAATAHPASRTAPAPSTWTFCSSATSTICEPDWRFRTPRLSERAFVLIPLNEVAPLALDARSGKTVSQLLQNLQLVFESAKNAVVSSGNEGLARWR